MIFFLLKTIDLLDVFFAVNQLSVSIQSMFFRHQCPPMTVIVLYPGKGECADPVNKDAILEKERGGESQGQNGERQLTSDTGGGKT